MVQLYFSTEMTGVLFRVSASRKRGLGGSQEKRKKKKHGIVGQEVECGSN